MVYPIESFYIVEEKQASTADRQYVNEQKCVHPFDESVGEQLDITMEKEMKVKEHRTESFC